MGTVTSTLTGKGYILVQANKEIRDEYVEDFKVIRKDMITESGDNVGFKNLTLRKTEHGGVISDLQYGSLINDEVHRVRKLNQKDNVVKSGLMSMEDIYIEAPYDSQLTEEAQYYYKSSTYQIIHMDPLQFQGKNAFNKYFGKKLVQQDDVSEAHDT